MPKNPWIKACLATVLLLALLELVTRNFLCSPKYDVHDPRYGVVRLPNSQVVQSYEGWSKRTTNSLGFCSGELTSPKQKFRVLLLGDSFSEALQVALEENFVSLAEKSLSGVEILNTGAPGRSPVEYADWIEEFGDSIDADMVVVQVNGGDLADLKTLARAKRVDLEKAATVAPQKHEGMLMALTRKVLSVSGLAEMLAHQSWLIVKDQQKKLNERFGDKKPPQAGDDGQKFNTLIDALHARIAKKAKKVVYLYIPGFNYWEEGMPDNRPDGLAFWQDFASRNGVKLINPSDEMRRSFYASHKPMHGFANSVIGTGHLNAEGHRIVSGALAGEIEEVRACSSRP